MCKGSNTGNIDKQLISQRKPFLGAFEKLRKSDSCLRRVCLSFHLSIRSSF